MRRNQLTLAALALLATLGPSLAHASEAHGGILVKRERESALSALLLAADGKLAIRSTIPGIKVTVLAGKGAWGSLEGAALVAAVKKLAAEKKIELPWVEADVVSRAEQGCCGDARLLPEDKDYEAHRAKQLGWATEALGMTGVRADGRGVVVALLDTGVDRENPFFEGAEIQAESILDEDRSPEDRNGHGTAMAGVLVARGRHALDPKGVAPAARLLSLKVLDDRGSGDVSTLARGIVRAVDLRARVVLVAAGVATPSRALEEAVSYARSRGAVVVGAAGNEPLGRALFPARTPGALGVTASREGGRLSLAVALDPAIELCAPGANVLTTLPTALGAKGVLGGTSLSAAFAAGVAALGFGEGADADQVLRAMRGARRPLAAFAGYERTFPLGELDAKVALERLGIADRAVDSVVTYPAAARPGNALRVVARVRATGGRASSGGEMAVLIGGARVASVALPALPQDGSAVDVEARLTVPEGARGELGLTVAISDEDPRNNQRSIVVPVAGAAPFTRLAVADLRLDDAARTLTAVIENAGETPAETPVTATVEGLPLRPLRAIELLAPGARGEVVFALPDELVADGIARFEVKAPGAPPAILDVRLGGADPRPVKPQYQQSDDVDLIVDAPYRLEPGRPYLPLLIFNPSKGDAGRGIDLTIQSATLVAQDGPVGVAGKGRLLYRYDLGANVAGDPARFVPGLEILDEDAKPLSNGSLNLFLDQPLTQNGRHAILRLPRSGFGVANVPAAPVPLYVDARLRFVARRNTTLGGISVDQGTTHKVLQILFASRALPAMPGAGRYYDTHVHTVAEWYVSSTWDLLAPRKAYGGPIHMIREASYAIGLTDQVNAAPGTIITTDHACFNNEQDPECMTEARRIQVGPTAPKNSPGPNGQPLFQLQRFRELFGTTANEEIAFEQDQKVAGPLGLPLGAHLLAFRAPHCEQRWNGGDGGASPNKRAFGTGALKLTEWLETLATKAGQANKDAFIFSAHPFSSSQGWNQESFDEGLDLKAAADGSRPGKYLNAATDNFVVKGHQLWNGRNTRSLPSSRIDWNDMNPFADPDFAKGDGNFARTLEGDILSYQQQLSQVLRFHRSSQPGRVFARKLYVAAGSDAHGDFNYTEERLATPISVKATFSVHDGAFGKARTYVLMDGVTGATTGDRGMNALAAGNSVVTDGPLAKFALDADGKFDGAKLVYHASASKFEDEDGRIGGGGVGPDGARTALVVAGSEQGVWGYRFEDAPEAAVNGIELYRVEAGQTVASRPVRDVTGKQYTQPAPAAKLPFPAAGKLLEAPADKATAGAFERLSAVQMAVFAGGADPAMGRSPLTSSRCYTNPIFVAPVKVELVKRDPDVTAGKFPKGSLQVRFTFPISMKTLPYRVEVKAVDAQGNTTDGSVAGVELAPLAGTGWSADAATKTQDAVFEVANAGEISLAQWDWPQKGTATFVVYFRDVPQDTFGNELNRIASTFEAPRVGNPPPPAAGSTAPGATGPTGFVAGGGKSGGGGCALEGNAGDARALLPVAVAAVLLLARRRRLSAAA